MDLNRDYMGNYSPTSFLLLQPNSLLKFDLNNKLNFSSSVREAQGVLQVFPISTDYGVNLQAPILEFHREDILLQHEQREDDQRELRHDNYRQITDKLGNAYSLSPILSTYGKRIIEKTEKYAVVFLLKLCFCKACQSPKKMIDAMQLEPFRTIVKLCSNGYSMDIMITFYPGATRDFNMREDVARCSPSKLVYYSNICVLPSFQLIPFKSYVATLHRLINSPEEESPQLEDKMWISPGIQERVVGVRNGLKPAHHETTLLERDLLLESSDKKRFSCHSPVFFAQGYTFKLLTLMAVQNLNKKDLQVVEVPEDSIITTLFVNWIYYQDDEVLKTQDFEVLIRILNLACRFQMLRLMGTVSKLLMEEMDKTTFLWKDEEMWRLYSVIRSVNEIQIVVRLREKVRRKVLSCNILRQLQKKCANTMRANWDEDGDVDAACSAYMDQVFFKILIDLIEKDDGDAAMVKLL